jgi:hypothetical protein
LARGDIKQTASFGSRFPKSAELMDLYSRGCKDCTSNRLIATFLLLVNIKALARNYEVVKEAIIRSSYSKMRNTRHDFWADKAVALQEETRRQTGDQYVAGLWKLNLLPPLSKPSTPSKVWYFWFRASYAP